MRIAFITPEFVTDYRDGGGLGNYLNRVGKLLVARGHAVEIFLSSALEPSLLEHHGIKVWRIPPTSKAFSLRGIRRVCRLAGFGTPAHLYLQARALANALERRHALAPFDFVQSADYMAVGYCVRRKRGRCHLVRCSTAADLYNQIDDDHSSAARWRERFELASMRRADKVYAPSRFVAEHLTTKHGLRVGVVRPPSELEVEPREEAPCGLPDRFLVHFGQLNRRKGTEWLGHALARACDVDTTVRMVWVGRNYANDLNQFLSPLALHRSKLQVLYPLPKPELLALIKRADASVLPSLVDNLPNTVIESLQLGIPVIGSRGASIDELVEPGHSGELIAPGDVEGLARALLTCWRGKSSFKKGFDWTGGIAEEMRPNQAIEALIQFARGTTKVHAKELAPVSAVSPS